MLASLDVHGTAEVATMLGVSKQRVKALTDQRILPTPAAVLASGPIWDGEALREFIATWDRTPGRRSATTTPKWRYVEVTYLDGPDFRWRSVLVQAHTADEAFQQGVMGVLETHPNALRVVELLQRTVTEERASAMFESMQDDSWKGWFGQVK